MIVLAQGLLTSPYKKSLGLNLVAVLPWIKATQRAAQFETFLPIPAFVRRFLNESQIKEIGFCRVWNHRGAPELKEPPKDASCLPPPMHLDRSRDTGRESQNNNARNSIR